MKFAEGSRAGIDAAPAAMLCFTLLGPSTKQQDRIERECVTRGVGLHDGLYRMEQQVFYFTSDARGLFIVTKIERDYQNNAPWAGKSKWGLQDEICGMK